MKFKFNGLKGEIDADGYIHWSGINCHIDDLDKSSILKNNILKEQVIQESLGNATVYPFGYSTGKCHRNNDKYLDKCIQEKKNCEQGDKK